MRWKIIGIGFVALLVLLATAGGAVFVLTSPERPAEGTASRAWLDERQFLVDQVDLILVDESRPTDENRGVPGKPERTFPLTVWYPRDVEGRLPLIIYSHGILSNRTELEYAAAHLAGLGYIVAAPDYPLTSGNTEGGANALDVVNQPADISFLIDSLLEWPNDERPFAAEPDPGRIGLSGYSLGGLTSYLATYHPRWRDPRVRATAAIAGPSTGFTTQFFSNSDAQLLSIAGTADALIEYATNGATMLERAPGSSLLVVEGGSHLGFNGLADPAFRFMDNPDGIACAAVLGVLDDQSDVDYGLFGDASDGVDTALASPEICGDMPPPEAIHPGRQLMITLIALSSFFESVFAEDPMRRQQAWEQLSVHLPTDFAEASFETNR